MLEHGAAGVRRPRETHECDNVHRAPGEDPGNLSLIQQKHLRIYDHPPTSSSSIFRMSLTPIERLSRDKTRDIYSGQPTAVLLVIN